VPKQQADFISEVLMGLDCVSVTFSDTNDDAIFEPKVGETPLWQNVTITALFDVGADQDHVKDTLKRICSINEASSLIKSACCFEVFSVSCIQSITAELYPYKNQANGLGN
jgi:ribosomal protein L11 methylase PrmA